MSKQYNTEAKKLALPEYGRHIQNMVDICVKIEDRAERQKCAESIINTMTAFFVNQKDREDYMQVLWDHLYIMSDYKLDVDFPYEVSSSHEFMQHPDIKLPSERGALKFRHYGHSIEKMIDTVLKLPEGEERRALEIQTAIQMKRAYITWNKDNVDNVKIFTDLYQMSDGKIYLDEFSCKLPDARELQNGTAQISGDQNNGRKNNNKRRKR